MRIAWGKRQDSGAIVPLRVHMADVAACFELLTSTGVIAQRLTIAAGHEIDPITLARLCVIAFLHDVGKLNSGFQFKVEEGTPSWLRAGHVAEALRLSEPRLAPLAAALGLPEMASDWGPGFNSLFLAALAHHGRPVSFDAGNRDDRIWLPLGEYDPLEEARSLGAFLRSTWPKAFGSGPTLPESAEFQHFFAGLVALADQIGSREDIFGFGRPMEDWTAARSMRCADAALRALHLDPETLRQALSRPAPSDMFGWRAGALLRPLQTALRDLPLDHRLVVLEAETGSGKTEAAFLRFQRLFEAGEVDALYFAVPTRAAASSLHARIDKAARAFFSAEAVLALPGYLKIGTAIGEALPQWQVRWDDDPDEARRQSRWAAETPRRYLAAPVAVGTVDQAMLAGLQVKWAHFRAAALSRALLVVDEVHASDVYMTAILGQVVRDHVARGGHALLMSATLGAGARAHWLGGPRAEPSPDAPYPALGWWADGREHSQAIAGDGRTKDVHVSSETIIDAPEAIARLALDSADRGARVLIIRNTVAQAIAVQQAIEALHPEAPLLSVGSVAAPHHGRFALEDRRLLDAAVEDTFGKNAPERAIIAVGTQTLEQSLDIDADLLLSDLCPIDVLLQRIGRLHRHGRPRPAGFDVARCLVLAPDRLAPGGGLMRFGLGQGRQSNGIYADIAGLEAVLRAIASRPVWHIPADNRHLVEAGTDPGKLTTLAAELGPDWERDRFDLDARRLAQGQQGRLTLIDRSRGFDGQNELFAEDERILTRLGGDRLVVSLPEGTTGPFGKLISQITVPRHMMGAATADDAAAIEEADSGVAIRLGPVRLRYDRFGLRSETDA